MQKTGNWTEQELVSRLYRRDQEAFSYLYDHYSAALYGVILRIVKDAEFAQDMLQEAFLKIWNHLDQYDSNKGRLFTWMINICRHMAIDATRSRSFQNQKKNLPVESLVGVIDRQGSSTMNPDRIGLRAFVDGLSPEHRELIELAYFRGFTQAEIADRLQIPLGTVKTRMRTAVLKLRDLFK